MQTTRRSMDDNEVIPKDQEKGGRRYGYSKQRNEAIDSPTPRSEAGTSRIASFTELAAENGIKTKAEKGRNRKGVKRETKTNAEERGMDSKLIVISRVGSSSVVDAKRDCCRVRSWKG